MASNARNLSKLLGTSTQVPTTALPQAIADLETIGTSLSGGDIAPKNISSNTLTQSFDSNQTVNFIMSDSIDTISPIISVFKEVPQPGVSSKGNWDVNANATNYEFFDEKPIYYSSSTLTPSATGDGTFTNSSAIVTPYMLSNLSYDSKSFDASTQLGNAEGIAFKSDGTAMYLIGFSNDKVWQYTLSTPYDISTASYSNKSFSVASQDGYPRDVRFKSDGTIMYVIASTAPDSVYQYTLSTAWDVSTASYANKSLNVQTQSINPAGLVLSPDGTKVYVADYSSKIVFQYNLSTAWDVSTGTYSNNSINVSSGVFTAANPVLNALEINADGSKLFVATNYEIAEYNIPSGDLSNPTYINMYDVQDTGVGQKNIGGMAFANSGAKFYIFGLNDMHAYQFSSTASLAFNAADVGKKVVGNSGSAIITGTSGTYKSITPFADTSTISSWQLYGAEGKSDGSGIKLSGYSVGYDLSNVSYDNKEYVATQVGNYPDGIAFKSDGTAMYITGYGNDTVYQYTLSTAWDVSTASYANKSFSVASQDGVPRDIRFKPDGTIMYIIASTAPDSVYQYTLSTAWDVSTASYANKSINVSSQDINPAGLALSPDGTKVYICGYNSKTIFQYNLSTAWDLSTSSYSNNSLSLANDFNYALNSISINSTGTKIYISNDAGYTSNIMVAEYNLPSDGDISNSTHVNNHDFTGLVYTQNVLVGSTKLSGIAFSSAGDKFYSVGAVVTDTSGGTETTVYQFSTSSETHPYSQYYPALTNSSNGQINSSSWLDINSMTADETKNGGDIFYAVSTDNRTSWGVAKGSDGVRKIARNNSGTWQYNNDAGSSTSTYYNADGATYNSAQSGSALGSRSAMYFNSTGTKSIKLVIDAGYLRVRSYTYTTPYDLTTESYTGETFNPTGTSHTGLYLKPDGTKFYVTDFGANRVVQYDMSTAFDPSSATAGGNGEFVLTATGGTQYNVTQVRGIEFKPDGSRMYVADSNTNGFAYQKYIQYDLSTPWDVTTASHAGQWVHNPTFGAPPRDLAFWPDGTKVLIVYDDGSGTDVRALQYTLSVAWDITSTMTATSYYLDIGINATNSPFGGKFAKNGELFIVDGTYVFNMGVGGSTVGYGTSETWVNGTNNNEHATLQEALGAQAFNRMNKAQLDAVADGYHFSQDSADTLDLMIAPYAASGASPISDGVTINYDAEALVREAVAGTDYIAEFPSPNRLDIKSLINGNLKIRAQ